MYWIILSFITYQFHLILQTLGLGYEQEGTMVPVRVRVVQYHAHLSLSLSVRVPHTANDMLSFDKCKRDKKIKKSH